MAHPSIRQLGDPVLRSVCSSVQSFDNHLAQKASDMEKILQESGGVGLAAPQIGSLQRILLYYRPYTEEEGEGDFRLPERLQVLVNPEWTSAGEGQQPALEGCLSLPDIQLPVIREESIYVLAQGLSGERLEWKAEGLEARIIQHEIDHLDGKLILDRVSPELRREALFALRSTRG